LFTLVKEEPGALKGKKERGKWWKYSECHGNEKEREKS